MAWRTIAVTALPAAAKVEGRAERVISWTDTLGDNHPVFSSRDGERNESRWRAVWLRHWATKDGATRLVREVKEHSGDCAFDVTTEFVDPALRLTDLDGDGVAELTFAYRVGCRSDVSPLTLKLLVLEGGDKYILRGETVIDAGDARYGGAKKLDPSLVNGPPAFRRHADVVWARIVAE